MHERDRHLKHAILEGLHGEPAVEDAAISVSVRDGAVRLSGEVGSLSAKLLAHRSAMRVQGVLAVADEMTVKAPAQ